MSVATEMVAQEVHGRSEDLCGVYAEATKLIERLHRGLLDVVKDEFERAGRSELNAVQALLLYNIGARELTAGELRSRGHYLGSNVSYNLKKLVEMDYLHHERSDTDRRSVRVRLTEKGNAVRDQVDALYQRHSKSLEQVGGLNVQDFERFSEAMQKLERFWSDQIRYRL